MIPASGENRAFQDFWEAPHRPLFLAAFLCALFTVAWWPLGVTLGVPSPAFEPAAIWHIHELIFGFAGAAIGGYLLTALPGWTATPPVRGGLLKALVLIWLLARLALALSLHVPHALPILFNAGYFLLLAAILGARLISAGSHLKLGYVFAVAALGLGEVLFATVALSERPWASLTLVPAVLTGLVLLMASVGMRAIPAFTQNWFARNGQAFKINRDAPVVQVLLVACIVMMLIGWDDMANATMISAGMALLWVMRRWHGLSVLSDPLLAALHLAFLWLSLGLIVVGLAGLAPAIYPASDALHAITIGGMSGLIMAVSGRAAAHTESGDMQATPGFIAGVVLIWAATWVRLAAPVFPGASLEFAAAAIWCIAWVSFVVGFLPALTGPVRRPVLSGRRHGELTEIITTERTGQ